MRKDIIVILSMIFVVSMLGGCSRAEGFQAVENITAVEFSCGPLNLDGNDRFDLENDPKALMI